MNTVQHIPNQCPASIAFSSGVLYLYDSNGYIITSVLVCSGKVLSETATFAKFIDDTGTYAIVPKSLSATIVADFIAAKAAC